MDNKEKINSASAEPLEVQELRKNYEIVSEVTPWGVRFIWKHCLLGFATPNGRVLKEPYIKYLGPISDLDGVATVLDKDNKWCQIAICV